MTKNNYSLQLCLMALSVTLASAAILQTPTSGHDTAIIQILGNKTVPVFKLKTKLVDGLKVSELTHLTEEPNSLDLHEHMKYNRNKAESIHKSWIDDLIGSSDAAPASQTSLPVYNFIQVSFGIIYTKSNPEGYLVVLDTGSSHAVLPLSYQVTDFRDTYKGIHVDNLLLFIESIYYGQLVVCPDLFKDGYMCTSASYVSDASNSVVGTELLSTGSGNSKFMEVVTEYKLNLLRGGNAELVGIFGIGFGLRGFKTAPFLTPYYSTAGPQNIQFTQTVNDTPTSKTHDDQTVAGLIKINTEFNEEDYKWTYFDKRGLNYSLTVMYGIYITTTGKPGVYDMPDYEFSFISAEMKRDRLPKFGYNNFMFDSGTNGFILDNRNANRVLLGLQKIYGAHLLSQNSNGTVYVCWPDKNTAYRYKLTPPTDVYLNILLENIKVTISLEGMSLFDLEIEGGNYNCTYALVTWGRGVQILGYPAWKKLDLLWDANGSRVGIKSGITNK